MTNSPNLFEVVAPLGDPDQYPEPTNGPYFIWSQKGWFVHRPFHFGRGLFPTADNPTLPEVKPYLWHDLLDRIPIEVVGQAWSFFRKIWELRKSEAMVDLVYDDDQKRREKRARKQGFDDRGYRLMVWPQEASSGGVQCKRDLKKMRGQMVGTIHSHCNFNAFHSGTDTHDADSHDGLHITIGHVDQNPPQLAIMMSIGKIRWHFQLDEMWTEPKMELVAHPTWWNEYVKEPSNRYQSKNKTNGATVLTNVRSSTSKGQTPKPTGTIHIPGTSTAKSNGEKKPYYTVETLIEDDKALQIEEIGMLVGIQDLLDEITRECDKLGYDFDYEWNRQVYHTTPSGVIVQTPSEEWRQLMAHMEEHEA